MNPDRRSGGRRTTLAGIAASVFLVMVMLIPVAARSEPYLAVRSGQKCMACHVNPTGGGKRTDFGSLYGQTALVRQRIDFSALGTTVSSGTAAESAPWTGRIGEHFALGADLRANFARHKVPGSAVTSGLDPTRAQVYLEARLLGDRLVLYLDERLAPDTIAAREAYALLWLAERRAYLKAGRMYVPFGLRIEDDTAFIRRFSGVNFNVSEDGVEGGLELGPWSASLSVTNGPRGGSASDRGKVVSAITA